MHILEGRRCEAAFNLSGDIPFNSVIVDASDIFSILVVGKDGELRDFHHKNIRLLDEVIPWKRS